jgi:ribonuclease-3
VEIIDRFLGRKKNIQSLQKQLENVLGIKTRNISLYTTALSHRSVKENTDENNERLEYLGDAVLSSIVADYLFKKYPYKGEGFLTEMRSKMVNRQQLNDIAIKIGLKKLALYNKIDGSLKGSQIFGNTLEALIGAFYLDKGYRKTQKWVTKHMIIPHLYVDDLELIDINLKNKLIGWATKNLKSLEFQTVTEKLENNRRVFTIAVVLDGELLTVGKGYNKKEASQVAAQLAIEKLGL